MKKDETYYIETNFCGSLTIVFIVLKLLNIITWSWIWVLAPLWIPTVLLLGILIIVLLSS